jgi:hypothetical protein
MARPVRIFLFSTFSRRGVSRLVQDIESVALKELDVAWPFRVPCFFFFLVFWSFYVDKPVYPRG